MKTNRQTTRSLSSLAPKSLLEDEEFQKKVDEMFRGLNLVQQLIQLRKKQGLSQAQFAKMLGVSQPLIGKLESKPLNNIELKKLVRVVTALNGTLKLSIVSNGTTAKSISSTPKPVSSARRRVRVSR